MFKRRFRSVLQEAGVPPAAHDMRLFDHNVSEDQWRAGSLTTSHVKSPSPCLQTTRKTRRRRHVTDGPAVVLLLC